jgi:hypothetical protein
MMKEKLNPRNRPMLPLRTEQEETELLNTARALKRLRQLPTNKMSAQTGIHTATLTNYLNGKRGFGPLNQDKIARWLDSPANLRLRRRDEPTGRV